MNAITDGQTMADSSTFVVLRFVNKTPALASCTKCQRKFFTPNIYYYDPFGAEQYLRTKFNVHKCSLKEEKGHSPPPGARRPL